MASEAIPVRVRRRFGLRDLFRCTLWACSAALAVFGAVFAASTEIGRERLWLAAAEIHEILMPTGIKPIRPLDAREGRRLADTVRSLTVDRERLLNRIASLEQTVEGITGSIARIEQASKAPAPQPEAALPPVQAPAQDDITSSINPPANVPMPPQPPGGSRTEFGLDLGGAASVEALRTAWIAALRRHGPLLEGLSPVVQTRERPRPAPPEFRLIAGPVPNAAAAARLCSAMTAAGAICAPAVFDGQRLAGR